MASSIPVRFMLTCPECSKKSPFSEAVLVPGMPVACPRCGAELAVSHDRDTPDNPPVWRLEQPASLDEPRGRA